MVVCCYVEWISLFSCVISTYNLPIYFYSTTFELITHNIKLSIVTTLNLICCYLSVEMFTEYKHTLWKDHSLLYFKNGTYFGHFNILKI